MEIGFIIIKTKHLAAQPLIGGGITDAQAALGKNTNDQNSVVCFEIRGH
jgi:hypothetical protein